MEDENDIESGLLDEAQMEEYIQSVSNDEDGIPEIDATEGMEDDDDESSEDTDNDDGSDEEMVELGDYDDDGDGKGRRPESDEDDDDDELNPYEAFADELIDDGLLPEDADVHDLQSLKAAIAQRISDGIDARTARVSKLMDMGVGDKDIQSLEQAYDGLSTWTDDNIRDESDSGVELRRGLIVQAFQLKGMSPERAEREWNKSYRAGTDIEDAMDARDDIASYIKDQYEAKVRQAQEEQEAQRMSEANYYKSVQDEILNSDEGIYAGCPDEIRQSVLEHDDDYERFVDSYPAKAEAAQRFLFALTNGYRDLSILARPEINRQKRASAERMERALRNSYHKGGGLRVADAMEDDDEGVRFI